MYSISIGRHAANAVAMVFLTAGAHSPVPLLAAHPLITDDTGTQGRGNVQIELTTEHGYEQEDGTRENTVSANAVFSYGVHDAADVILTLPHKRISSEAEDGSRSVVKGQGDIGLDVKWRFYEKDNLSFALKPGLTLPTGDEAKNLGSGRARHSLYLTASYDADPWEYHLHLGYIHNRNVLGQHESQRHVSVAVGRKLGERLKLVADYGTDTPVSQASSLNSEFLVLGAIYSLRKALDLDVGAKWGLTKPEVDFTWLAGVVLRF